MCDAAEPPRGGGERLGGMPEEPPLRADGPDLDDSTMAFDVLAFVDRELRAANADEAPRPSDDVPWSSRDSRSDDDSDDSGGGGGGGLAEMKEEMERVTATTLADVVASHKAAASKRAEALARVVSFRNARREAHEVAVAVARVDAAVETQGRLRRLASDVLARDAAPTDAVERLRAVERDRLAAADAAAAAAAEDARRRIAVEKQRSQKKQRAAAAEMRALQLRRRGARPLHGEARRPEAGLFGAAVELFADAPGSSLFDFAPPVTDFAPPDSAPPDPRHGARGAALAPTAVGGESAESGADCTPALDASFVSTTPDAPLGVSPASPHADVGGASARGGASVVSADLAAVSVDPAVSAELNAVSADLAAVSNDLALLNDLASPSNDLTAVLAVHAFNSAKRLSALARAKALQAALRDPARARDASPTRPARSDSEAAEAAETAAAADEAAFEETAEETALAEAAEAAAEAETAEAAAEAVQGGAERPRDGPLSTQPAAPVATEAPQTPRATPPLPPLPPSPLPPDGPWQLRSPPPVCPPASASPPQRAAAAAAEVPADLRCLVAPRPAVEWHFVQGEKLALERRSCRRLPYFLNVGDVLHLEFCVRCLDVGFGISERTMSEGGAVEVELLPTRRFDSNQAYGGHWPADRARTVVLLFDNSYSRLRGKDVAYSARVQRLPELQPEDSMTTKAVPPSMAWQADYLKEWRALQHDAGAAEPGQG
ncbi:hypothetical protein M885DRAFT_623312 [Pelagophyceae sp. CCMP2097]|nr:hypothetical protein M885DRAFT_623312 [Pelagophyceae sp. CCMP2097]|mmetsp:Transcript_22904/g.78355  ORF Transcript_22904/g.78355 Transcript_22904/m.78355 type:complete len:722 (-) Transcript_22904:22-2187(-)